MLVLRQLHLKLSFGFCFIILFPIFCLLRRFKIWEEEEEEHFVQTWQPRIEVEEVCLLSPRRDLLSLSAENEKKRLDSKIDRPDSTGRAWD